MKKFILIAFITLFGCLNTFGSVETTFRNLSETELTVTQTNKEDLGMDIQIDLDDNHFVFKIQDVQVKEDGVYVFGTCSQNIKMIHFYDGKLSIPTSGKRAYVVPCQGYHAIVDELIKLKK